MKTNNKKKSIIKKILSFSGAIFCSIVCAFSLFSYSDTKSMEVSADEISYEASFYSSNIYVNAMPFWYKLDSNGNRNGSYNLSCTIPNFLSFSTEFAYVDGVLCCRNPFYNQEIYHNQNNSYRILYINAGFDRYNNTVLSTFGNRFFPIRQYSNYGNLLCGNSSYSLSQSSYSYGLGMRINMSSSDLVIQDISRISISSDVENYPVQDVDLPGVPFVGITYYDSNGNWINFFIFQPTQFLSVPQIAQFTPSPFYSTRSYLLKYDLSSNDYYQLGKVDGFTEGFEKGEDNGYSDGFKNGRDEGFWEGKQSVIDGEQFSFVSLISSVVDVPVRTFTSLFNFEILGVNLSGFLLGLFTLSVAIFIIKLII